MRIGYPCMNLSLGCTSARTFRLRSYSEERLISTVNENLQCLRRILEWNVAHGISFFRITSDLVPFASHPVCRFDWQKHFRQEFSAIGRLIRRHDLRVSMHPDQFVVLNSPRREVFINGLRELAYQADVLDLLGTDLTAKLQVHIGGVYGDRSASLDRFARRWKLLSRSIKRRLVIENDDVSFPAADCLEVNRQTGIPVVFDVFHHQLNSRGESVAEMVRRCAGTWSKKDGMPIADFSSQEPGGRRGRHASALNRRQFRQFLRQSQGIDIDVMLEIKDKELSALAAKIAARGDPRLGRARGNDATIGHKRSASDRLE